MKRLILLLLFTGAVFSLVAQPTPKTGQELIKQMYRANKDQWYSTLLFSQEVVSYRNDSLVSKDLWHEAYLSPGNLILKFTSWESGNGMIFTKDSLYSFKEGTLDQVRYRMHDLIVLGLDVNSVAPKITAERVLLLGYDLSRIAATTCLGRKAWVVGDTNSLCFWVDRETLLFLKMRRGFGENAREVEFAKYEMVEGLPVATEIRFYETGGKLSMVERYLNVRPNLPVDTSIFNPGKFVEAMW